MSAADGGVRSATHATPLQIDFALFDRKCAELGAKNDVARAELIGVDRATLWRWRAGRQRPRLEVATRIAEQLDISVEELIGRAAA